MAAPTREGAAPGHHGFSEGVVRRAPAGPYARLGRGTLRGFSAELFFSSASLRIQRLILLAPRLPAETHRAPACLPFAEPFFGLDCFLLPLAGLALFMAFPTVLRVSVLTTAFTTTFPKPPMWLPTTSFSRDCCAKERRVRRSPALAPPPPGGTLVGSLRALET